MYVLYDIAEMTDCIGMLFKTKHKLNCIHYILNLKVKLINILNIVRKGTGEPWLIRARMKEIKSGTLHTANCSAHCTVTQILDTIRTSNTY